MEKQLYMGPPLSSLQLENHDSAKQKDNGFRSLEEMEREARHLATFFPSQ